MTAEPVAEPKPDKSERHDARDRFVQWLFGKDSTTVLLFVAIFLISYQIGIIQPARDIAIEERHTRQIETIAEKFDRDQERDNDWLKSLMFNRPAQGQLQGQTQSNNFKFGYDHGELVREQIAKQEQDDATVYPSGMQRDRGGHHGDAGGDSGGPGASGGGHVRPDAADDALESVPVFGDGHERDAVAGADGAGEEAAAGDVEDFQAPR